METSTTTTWLFSRGRLITPDTNQFPEVGVYFDGVLELLPGAVRNGAAGELTPVGCVVTGYSYGGLTFYSSGECGVNSL